MRCHEQYLNIGNEEKKRKTFIFHTEYFPLLPSFKKYIINFNLVCLMVWLYNPIYNHANH